MGKKTESLAVDQQDNIPAGLKPYFNKNLIVPTKAWTYPVYSF
jgi:hypothetical protein